MDVSLGARPDTVMNLANIAEHARIRKSIVAFSMVSIIAWMIFLMGVLLMTAIIRNTSTPMAPASEDENIPEKIPPMITTATMAIGMSSFKEISFSFHV